MFSVSPGSAPLDWLGSDQLTCVFCALSVPRIYLQDIQSYKAVGSLEFSSVREAVKKRVSLLFVW